MYFLRGMVNFSNKDKSLLKSFLSRYEQSKNTYLLKDVAGVKINDSAYTVIRPSRTLHSFREIRNVSYKITTRTLL